MASTSRGSSTSGKGKSKAKTNNTSLIEQFCSVTGADETVAQRMLEACSGNLEMAINMHVDGECLLPSPGPSSQPQDMEIPPDENVRAPFPPVRAVLVEEGFGFGFRTRKRATQSVFDGFRDFQAETRLQEQQLSSLTPAAYKKRKTLEDLFRPPLDLIHHGTFESARDLGQSQNKWLMVNVQNGQEFSCQVLNRDVWSNAAVKSIVKEHFVFWQVYHDSEEGQRYVQFYKVMEYPYIAVLDPLTGEMLVSWNKVESSTLCDIISEFLIEQPSPDGSSANHLKFMKKAESIVDKTEEQQLQAAIQASLQEEENEEKPLTQAPEDDKTSSTTTFSSSSDEESIDLETFDSDTEAGGLNSSHPSKETNGRVENAKRPSKENESFFVATSLTSNNHQEEEDEREEKRDGQWTNFLGPEADPKSELLLRFPDGERKQFSLACTSRLQALLMYITSQGFAEDDYEVVTTFPRRQLSSLSRNSLLKDIGLFPRETIYIQSKNT